MKKYTVQYNASPTSYGIDHTEEVDTITEVENLINEYKKMYQSAVRVFDSILNDYIFYKHIGTTTPEIDLIDNYKRDLRTTNRITKGFK
jgi:hypothetical protein